MFILFLIKKLPKNGRHNKEWKKYLKIYVFHNFICSQFHNIQMNLQTILTLFLTFGHDHIKKEMHIQVWHDKAIPKNQNPQNISNYNSCTIHILVE